MRRSSTSGMKLSLLIKKDNLIGDLSGGFSAMLVALPSAIAFGLIIFAPLGGDFAGRGALAGLIGSVVLGIAAPLFGGTPRLVSAPCAPAAALLSMFAAGAAAQGLVPRDIIPLYIGIVALGAGLVQITAGLLRGGAFIKYIPYPVVAGYLSGVGTLIFLGELPKFLGLPKGTPLLQVLAHPALLRWESLLIGSVTIIVMLITPRLIRVIPASIAALGSGIAAYFGIAFFHPGLLSLDGNALLVGRIHASPGDIASMISGNLKAAASLDLASLQVLVVPVISLGVLLSIDTLKTCVVLDVLTGHRHDSNRELFGQGVGNILSPLFGGVPGSGTMGGTLVNVYSGGRTRFSGLVEGISALTVLLLFAGFIAWIPLASLAGVLLVVGVRMVDIKSLQLLKHKSTLFDFAVILAVVISAVSMDLITAAGVGIVLAIILFLRDQIRFPVVRRRTFGSQAFSRKNRPASEHALLVEKGSGTLILELQGQLFFGTTDQLYREIEPFIGQCRFFILDMRRVLSIDFTAANMLSQLKKKIVEGGGVMIFTSVPASLPTGLKVRSYLEKLGFSREGGQVRFFPETDNALEWTEEKYLNEAMPDRVHGKALELEEIDFFKGIPGDALVNLKRHVIEKHYAPGEIIFSRGDPGDELYFVRKGSVRIDLPLGNGTSHHLATFSRGAFFGDLAFLDRETRSADAVAVRDVDLFMLHRREFDVITKQYPEVAGIFFERLSLEISRRMRLNVIELKALEEG